MNDNKELTLDEVFKKKKLYDEDFRLLFKARETAKPSLNYKIENFILEKSMVFVVQTMNKYKNHPLFDYNLFFSYGENAIIESIYKYNYLGSASFSTYCINNIVLKMYNAFKFVSPVSYSHLKNSKKIEKFINDFNLEKSTFPTYQEISEGTGIEYKLVCDIVSSKYMPALSMDSLIKNNDDENIHLGDTIRSNENDALAQLFLDETKQKLYDAISQLSSKQQLVINLTFGLNGHPALKQAEIAKILNLTHSAVSHLKLKAFAALKKNLALEDAYNNIL